jgi:hypothetical protein
VKALVLFGVLLPASVLLGLPPTFTLITGVLGIGLMVGFAAESIRDTVVDAGVVASVSGVVVVLTPIIASTVGFATVPPAVNFFLLFPVFVIASTIVSLGIWYLDWYLTLRHGSTAKAVGLWVSGTDDPRLKHVGTGMSPGQVFVLGGSLALVAVLVTALVAPTAFVGLIPSSLSEPVEPAEPVSPIPSEPATVYAGVSVEQVQTDAGPAVEAYVYNFGTADSITVTNERTGTKAILTPASSTAIVTGASDDTLVITAVSGETESELNQIKLT